MRCCTHARAQVKMEFSESPYSFNHLIDTPFTNLLDDEIPQDIFEEIMNDINDSAASALDVNSMSSDDSLRSSGSMIGADMPAVMLKEEPIEMVDMSPGGGGGERLQPLRVVEVAQPLIAADHTTFARLQQPQLIISHPKILVKKEPIAFQSHVPSTQFINIGGQLYTTVTNGSPTTVRTIHTDQGSIDFSVDCGSDQTSKLLIMFDVVTFFRCG